MTLRSRATAEILGGLAAGALVVALVVTSGHDSQRAVTAILAPLVGWAFIGSGILARARRPENPTGLLLMAVGFVLVPRRAGRARTTRRSSRSASPSAPSSSRVFVHLLATYPTGRIETRPQRVLVGRDVLRRAVREHLAAPRLGAPGPARLQELPGSAILVFDSKRRATR